MKIILITSVAILTAILGCSGGAKNVGEGGDETPGETTTIRINPDRTFQTIDGFGASDAWRTQFVGQNWPLPKREQIADLLFSREFDDSGNPQGIGLSIWRFYIGAGSKEQGEDSGIANEWRRAPSFLDAEGNWDWSKYQGQRWFLDAAKERGVDRLLAFTISPPVFMTRNGKAWAPGGNNMNIRDGKMDDYADFLVEIIHHFHNQENITFDYLSPINEPQWNWENGGQEGTPATNSEIHDFVKLIAGRLDQRGLPTEITLGEAGHLEHLYKETDLAQRSDQVDAFFNPSSENYIGEYPNVKHIISGHSYYSTWPVSKLLDERRKLAAKINQVDSSLGFWMSEFCILQENDDITGGWDRDLGMNTALYVARVIHHDLTLANARSWQWWTALSQFDFKDGLIYLDDGQGGVKEIGEPQMESLKYDGNFRESKLLWALGNYSRFVRPGMMRIGAENLTDPLNQPTNLMTSAYLDEDNSRMVVVFVNYSEDEQPVAFDIEDGSLMDKQLVTYTTAEKMDLEKQTANTDSLVIPSRSVVTAIAKIKR